MLSVSLVVNFTVDYLIRFRTWNSRFLSRLIEEVFESGGHRIQHNAKFKPFTVTPILNEEGKIVSALEPHVPYWFRVSLFCGEVNCQGIIDALTKRELRLSTGEVIIINRVDVINHEFRGEGNSGDDPTVIYWRVRFWPTSFIFRSSYVSWPSPARFLSSAALTLTRVLRGSGILMSKGNVSLVGVIGNVDLKDFVKDLTFNTEVINFRVRRFTISLGKGRGMPAFSGVAEYVTYTDKPSLFRLLLDIANVYGVGKNRALGLGYVNAEIVKQHVLH